MELLHIFLALYVSLLPPCFSVRTLDPRVVLPKCCPEGKTFKDAAFSECVQVNYKYNWPAKEGKDGNIHFGVDDDDEGKSFTFNAESNLKYDESTAWSRSSQDVQRCRGRSGHDVSLSLGFSIDSSGHATVSDLQTVSNKKYCLEYFEGSQDDESLEVGMLHCDEVKRHYVPKCCKINELLNLRSGKCEPHKRELGSISEYVIQVDNCEDSDGQLSNLYDSDVSLFVTKASVNTENLNIQPQRDGSLHLKLKFQGKWKEYTKDFYCIDHVMDYCEACDCDEGCKDKLSHAKALIRDPEIGLRGYEKEFNIFGSHSESTTSKIIKVVGYPISAFFLVFSLIVINRFDPNKYWIDKSIQTSLTTCLTIVYISLIVRTIGSFDVFYDYQISSKIGCTLIGIFVYYFIMASFAWMTVLGFQEVYKKCVGENMSALMKETVWTAEQNSMMTKYNLFAYGVPFLMVTSVLVVEIEANGESPSCFANAIRPGFGEESCWFALCSAGGQGLFIYMPIGLAMASNLVMFTICIYKMYLEEEEQHREEEKVEMIERQNSEERRSLERQPSDLWAGVRRQRSVNIKIQTNTIRRKKIAQAFELFVIMGLTWVIEFGTFVFTDRKAPPPESAIIVMNFVNIVQGVIIFGAIAHQSRRVTQDARNLKKQISQQSISLRQQISCDSSSLE